MSIEPQFCDARGGVRLAWREVGEGAPVVLLHGLFSSAEVNWIQFGTAARVAADGYRVIIPDLRVHGSSEAPHEAGHYPPDRSEEHTSELQSLMRISYAVFCLKKKNYTIKEIKNRKKKINT